MEEKKTPSPKPDVAPQVDLLDTEPIVAAMEQTPEPTAAAAVSEKASRSVRLTIISALVVLVGLLGVWYVLEKDGRVDSNVFGALIEWQESRGPVATVNGVEIDRDDLAQTATQLSQGAAIQGADVADPAVQSEVQAQALQLLIRTELLTQAAEAEGITVSDEAIAERLQAIEAEAGGAENLATRMEEFEITEDMLRSDVESELTIQALLEQVISSDQLAVTEEEVRAVYDEAATAGVEVPPFEEVSQQIEVQLAQTKQNTLVEEYLAELEQDADIVVNQ